MFSYACSSQTKWWWVPEDWSLRYSRSLPKGSLLEKSPKGWRANRGMLLAAFWSQRGEPAEGSLNLSITTP